MPLTPEQERLIKSIPYLIQNQKTSTASGSSIPIFWGCYGALGGNSTSYFSSSAVSTVESAMQYIVPVSGTISYFSFTTYSSQPSDGSYVLTFRKNGASTSLSATVAASASAGFFSDNVHSFTVSAGDKISIQGINNSAVTTSAAISGFSFKFTPK